MNVLIIDDHQILKEGIQKRVKKVLKNANCYFEDNIRSAIAIATQTKIDLILCDLEFNNETEVDGIYIIKSILKFEPKVKTIAFTNYNSYRVMEKAIKSGFHSFLDKSCSFEDFSQTLTNVVKSGNYESPTMKQLRKKRNKFLQTIYSDSLYGISDLSPRERELTLLSAKTTDRQELAKKMKVKPYTIDTYFKNILSKLQLKHRQELSLFSLEFRDELLRVGNNLEKIRF